MDGGKSEKSTNSPVIICCVILLESCGKGYPIETSELVGSVGGTLVVDPDGVFPYSYEAMTLDVVGAIECVVEDTVDCATWISLEGSGLSPRHCG